MPGINIYTKETLVTPLEKILPELQKFAAEVLSCGDRKLAPDEISLRIIVPRASRTIAETELEIKAFSYNERVEKQDEICLRVKEFIEKTCPEAGSVYVWLQLSELGHSAKN